MSQQEVLDVLSKNKWMDSKHIHKLIPHISLITLRTNLYILRKNKFILSKKITPRPKPINNHKVYHYKKRAR